MENNNTLQIAKSTPHNIVYITNNTTIEKSIDVNKQWLNTSEVAHYLGYSKESIHKMIKNQEFIQGIHFHKKVKRLLFDRIAVDNWVKSDSPSIFTSKDADNTIEDILSSIAA